MIADLLRAVAFIGIAFVPGIEATVAFAALAGIGTGLFGPAALAGLPSLVEQRRLPAATSLYGAISDLGFIVGPALAGAVLLLGSAETLHVGQRRSPSSCRPCCWARCASAPRRSARCRPSPMPGRRPCWPRRGRGCGPRRASPGYARSSRPSGAALFFAGIFNVVELPFATEDLGTTEAGYSMLAAILGLGFIGGSLAGSKGGELPQLRSRYLLGLLLLGVGLISIGLAPSFPVALATFALFGFGNGLVLVYERLLIQWVVPDRLAGRVFGVKDSLSAWAFGAAFVVAGGAIALVGARWLLLIAGAGGVAVWAISSVGLRRVWVSEEAVGGHLGHGPHPAGGWAPGQHRPDPVGGRTTGSPSWTTLISAETIFGSNCVPALASSSASAASLVIALR